MVKKENVDNRRENVNIVILGVFGLIIYAVLRMFELPISEENDLLMYAVWSIGVSLLSIVFVPDMLLEEETPQLMLTMFLLFIGGLLFYFFTSLSLGEFSKEIDLPLVSIVVMMSSLIKLD